MRQKKPETFWGKILVWAQVIGVFFVWCSALMYWVHDYDGSGRIDESEQFFAFLPGCIVTGTMLWLLSKLDKAEKADE